MKTCSKCFIEKDNTEFNKLARSPDGLNAWCRDCTKQYHEANKQRAKERGAEYYEQNRERILQRQSAYNEANREIISIKSKKYRDENREKMKAYKQTLKAKYSNYRSGAKQRNLVFELTQEQFQTFWQADCYYCGDQIATIGIDRIDSSIGYTIENCVPCCFRCNEIKMDHTIEETYMHMLKILKHKGII